MERMIAQMTDYMEITRDLAECDFAVSNGSLVFIVNDDAAFEELGDRFVVAGVADNLPTDTVHYAGNNLAIALRTFLQVTS
jgi:hypothetical protein